MKLCAACSQELQKEKFSKKQWQAKQQRRCKNCIADNREVNLEAPKNDVPPLPRDDGEGPSRWTDDELFKQPPTNDECPICMLTLPLEAQMSQYQECCGKMICMGCAHTVYTEHNRTICPFCRAPEPNTDGEYIKLVEKRVDADDFNAMRNLGCKHYNGSRGLRQNYRKAIKLWLRAGELGDAIAYRNLGTCYSAGRGVVRDEKKANHYNALAAMGGDAMARHNLGAAEYNAGNMERAVKHWMIGVGAGFDNSLDGVRQCFANGGCDQRQF